MENNLPKPIEREDFYKAYLAGASQLTFNELPKPVSRSEEYLYYLCENGIGSGGGLTPIEKETLNKVPNIEQKVNQNTSQLDEKARKSNFVNRLTKGEIRKVKLIGDSISAGAQCSGYNEPTDGRVILVNSRFNQGGTQGQAKETGTDWNTFPSWANLFRRYIKEKYPSIDFFNAGVGGISAKEMLTNYIMKPENKLIEADEDIIFLMLGTNDRGSTLDEYKTNLNTLIDYIKPKCNELIIMACPPTPSDFSLANDSNYPTSGNFVSGLNFGAREINQIVRQVADEKGLFFISNYDAITDYSLKTNTKLQDLIADKTHPTALGYKVMWNYISKRLDLKSELDYLIGTGTKDIPILKFENISIFANIPLGFSKTVLIRSEADTMNLGSAGTIVTIKPSDKVGFEGFTVQYFMAFGTGDLQARGYNGTTWSAWKAIGSGGGGTTTNYVTLTNGGILDNDLSTLKRGVNIGIIANAQGSTMPLGKGGTAISFKPNDANDGYVMQTYYPYGSNRIFTRTFNGTIWSGWNDYEPIKIASVGDGVLFDTPITSFSIGINYNYITGANTSKASFPKQAAGTLVTHRGSNASLDIFAYQEYYIIGSAERYSRSWTGSGWSNFI